ncbi:MAG: bifunctional hydroxymethylpyrimidine kinase/phosphomethylpyrimidine kinase [Lachnospiraceae bacterium]|nr:bifunctional hydroxymethylpyrimidine kinase/phosphomethylpyrimidine kinase [Lachnospiraceae bacterium]
MKVAAINDLSGFGKCSLVADIAILSSMGIEVNPVPTAVLTAQTGFSSYFQHEMHDMVTKCKEEWEKQEEEFDGILTGYIPSVELADQITEFVDLYKKDNTVLLVDPVMGDNGKPYANYSDQMLDRIVKLTEKADIITPNFTELCILAGIEHKKYEIDEIMAIGESVKAKGSKSVIVTGIEESKDTVCNLVISDGGTAIIRSATNGRSYSGTGDLFAASVLGNVLNGHTIKESVSKAADFIKRSIEATSSTDRNYGVDFEKILKTREQI